MMAVMMTPPGSPAETNGHLCTVGRRVVLYTLCVNNRGLLTYRAKLMQISTVLCVMCNVFIEKNKYSTEVNTMLGFIPTTATDISLQTIYYK